MLRILHTRLLAALLLALFAGQTPALLASAGATATPTINKAQLNQAVQEALAKQGAAGAASGSLGGAGGAGASVGGAGSIGSNPGSAAPSEGLGTSSSFSNLTSGGGEEEAIKPATANTNTSSSGVSTSVLLPIFIVGALLLGGIAFFIVRDARGVAPVADGLGNASAAQERAVRLRKRRAKAKAARRQRKRNR